MERTNILIPLVFISLFVVAVVVVLVLFFTSTPSGESVPAESPFPVDSATSTAPHIQAIVPLSGVVDEAGVVHQTRDFLNDPDVQLWDEAGSVYLLDESQNANHQATFQIFYYPEGRSIGISLLDQELGLARSQAEQALSARLGLSGEELCGLNITVTTPVFVSDEWSGFNLGLSMCEGSATLP